MVEFLLGFTACYLIGGAVTSKFVTDYFAGNGVALPRAGRWKLLALWPVMLSVVGRD